MKKRSLFAAVAMLIVSAILLTSSTYAWFAAQHEATVAQVVAKVDGKDKGNIMVSTSQNGTYKTSLTAIELIGGDGTKELDPVDIPTPKTTGVNTIKKADFDTLNFDVGDGAAGDLLTYSFWVKAAGSADSTANKKIVIPVSFSSGGCLYGLVAVGDSVQSYLYGTANDSYQSIENVTYAVDHQTLGTKGIIDSNDTITGTLTTQNVVADGLGGTSQIEITNDITSPTKITVYVWAEGQDSDCVGQKQVNDGGFTFGNSTTGIRLVSAS